ncbi:MAG: hypothetical protein RIR97_1382 [Pseudomonadota bacterium]
MIPDTGQKSVFRFAPSPNGVLHLGHALSACLNFDMARASDARFLLRMEDIDPGRCTPDHEAAIIKDLQWLGLDWEKPVRRQSEHLDLYRQALDNLKQRGLVYPAFLSRGEIRAHVREMQLAGKDWPSDPDGIPHYPPGDRTRPEAERTALIRAGQKHAWRLDMDRALAHISGPLLFVESGSGEKQMITADPAAWGDVVLWRSDAPSSYHLSVTVDDAFQGVTHVVRGADLAAATSVHCLLQVLLGLPQPHYHHHRLIMGEDGKKLSKSAKDQSLAELRDSGLSAQAIRQRVGL